MYIYHSFNRISGVMVSVLVASAYIVGSSPDRVEPDYKIGICCFSAKHTALRGKSNDWLAQNQDNMTQWGDMSTRGLLFQRVNTIKIYPSVLA